MPKYKTYFAAASMLAYAIGGAAYGLIEPTHAAEVVLAALALVGIAHKIEKATVAMGLGILHNSTPSKPEEKK